MKKNLLISFVWMWCAAFPAMAATDIVLTVSDLSLSAGGRSTLTVEASEALNAYHGFQFDVLLPQGVTVPYNLNPEEEEEGFGYYDADGGEWVPALASGVTKTSHVLTCSRIDGGCRIVCYHPSLSVLKSTSKVVITLVVEASTAITNGVYAVTLGGTVKLAKSDATSDIPTVKAGTAVITGGSQTATYSFTLTDAGWGTLMLPFNAEVPAGLTAYGCNATEEETLVLTATGTLTANTPYIVSGTAGSYSFTGLSTATQSSYTGGLLTGVFTPTVLTSGYVLQKNNGKVAFYRVTEEKSITVPACHCYLQVTGGGAGSPAYYLDRSTGLDELDLENAPGTVYDLSCKKLEGADKGIYIRNNRKVFIH